MEPIHPPSAKRFARGGLLRWINAFGMNRISRDYNRRVRHHKQRLLGSLSGTVLEIGPGTGANFEFYPPGIRWIGVEPSLAMQDYLRRAATAHKIEAEIITGVAEHLDTPDASVDAVVCTLVLCSVDDPNRVMSEILRVLRPGGQFVFLEHVAAPENTRRRVWQNRLLPLQKRLADGCHTNRETWRTIEQAGFSEVHIDHVDLDLGLVSPHIVGYAVK